MARASSGADNCTKDSEETDGVVVDEVSGGAAGGGGVVRDIMPPGVGCAVAADPAIRELRRFGGGGSRRRGIESRV